MGTFLVDESIPEASRRDMLRLTLASLVGLVFTGCGNSSVRPSRPDPLAGGWFVLPSRLAGPFMTRRLQTNATFARYLDYFTRQGYAFIPERVQLATDTPDLGPTAIDAGRVPPRLAVIAPSFRRFALSDPSHTAVSITATIFADHLMVASCVATVNHKPFGIESFELIELDDASQPVRHLISAETLKNATVEEIVHGMGAPTSRPEAFAEGMPPANKTEFRPAPSVVNSEMARFAYDHMLNDRFARPLYPSGAIDTLLAETPLVQKLAQVGQAFYGGIQPTSFSVSCCCCLTCCCCNGSCSCCAV